MAVKIRPIVLKDAVSYRLCWDTIAKERRYLAEYEAPPLSEVRARLRHSLRKKTPFLVAVDGKCVAGFAAVFSSNLPSVRHVGIFVIGLLPEFRGMGLGTKLMAGVLKMSRGRFGSVTIDVFRKNKVAQKLYKKMGFEPCGEIKRGVKLPSGFDDNVIMQKQLRR